MKGGCPGAWTPGHTPVSTPEPSRGLGGGGERALVCGPERGQRWVLPGATLEQAQGPGHPLAARQQPRQSGRPGSWQGGQAQPPWTADLRAPGPRRAGTHGPFRVLPGGRHCSCRPPLVTAGTGSRRERHRGPVATGRPQLTPQRARCLSWLLRRPKCQAPAQPAEGAPAHGPAHGCRPRAPAPTAKAWGPAPQGLGWGQAPLTLKTQKGHAEGPAGGQRGGGGAALGWGAGRCAGQSCLRLCGGLGRLRPGLCTVLLWSCLGGGGAQARLGPKHTLRNRPPQRQSADRTRGPPPVQGRVHKAGGPQLPGLLCPGEPPFQEPAE